MERPDEEVLKDYLGGNDEKAADMIFLRYKTRLLNFCLRMLGNRADAEDVTAEVFLALFARRYAFNPAAKFSTWLYTVARNQCISQIRKRKNVVSVWFSSKGGGDYEQMEAEDPRDTAGRELEKKEAATLVRAALAQLPYEQREVIVLREYHQFSYEEISQVVSCSLENVKILIFRGRERLRMALSSLIKEDQR
ncbi:MAG: sigma-70 family RNA polymerase sigma factor [Candidatus Omnitrophica bacterium]|nr:sigma-70 family RNA polymerase sigma factor [Candidatus Omnitrophota bacterium]MBI5023524.1 sigma-70 family RNA polymerase sigma factor [Candidatus Omnitrophota bacterium]